MRPPALAPDYSDRCPYCSTRVMFIPQRVHHFETIDQVFQLRGYTCPACDRLVVRITTGVNLATDAESNWVPQFVPADTYTVWPRYNMRPIPPQVPAAIADDYLEAAATLELSPKASATLSRRCLQAVLRDAAGANQKDLWQQIEAVLPTLPSYIARDVDAIRHVGNFAAHPMKAKASSELLDVEPGEAEWNLDVLDLLFDFYYVQPAVAEAKRDALNAKLAAAGKKPMK